MTVSETSLDEGELGGGDVESVNVGSKASVGLLATVGAT